MSARRSSSSCWAVTSTIEATRSGPSALEAATSAIVNKLLHTPTVRAKEAGSEPLRDLFALRDEPE